MNNDIREMLRRMSEDPQVAKLLQGRSLEKMLSDDPGAAAVLETGPSLSEADLGGCDFRDALFEGGSLRDAHLKNTRFDGADLRGVDLGGLKLAQVAPFFKGAIISSDQAAALVGELGVRVL